MVKVKICGLTQRQDVEAAVRLGADALGFVFEPSSPRFVGARVLDLTKDLPTFTPRVAVFGPYRVDTDTSALHLIQSMDFRGHTPSNRIQVLRLSPESTIDVVHQFDVRVEAVLLDAMSPQGYGGTGTKVDWGLAAAIVQAISKPVILAGGLDAENVAEAIRIVKPYAVDVSSGIEKSPGIKDHDKIARFIDRARSAG
jgi:phosphoribosylanthranilate isomerase